ncbi:unnamed protein product [Medioppia subpectinata]|uniref:ABC transporter n=1 Tax=Medioppia subpectinata TaxID=1979941 RepID=A0A7R9KL28_9ACAR|nr:unnamed protein product [Medioppia subpectinata]CAG2105241.1 unnamed protein product [Medioppia subpectinata]
MPIDEPTSGLDSNAAEVVINCLKLLSRKHEMTIIASIHQPNNDLLHMFDNIYVLAKGGVCLYSGVPHHLRQHLKDNGIECIENHVPIEVLLKIASKEISNKNNNNIEEKPNINNNGVNCDQILVSNMRPVFGSLSISKRFSFADMYYLLCRSLTHTFRCQWVSLLVQFAMMQTAALLMVYNSSSDMTEPDGCVELGAGFDSVQTIDLIRNEALIKLNIKYNICLLMSVSYIVVIVMSATFGTDFRVFRCQQQNGWYSTGVYLWCRTIVDLIPIFIALPVFCWITNLYKTITFYAFSFALNLLVVMCSQSVAQLSALMFINERKVALSLAILCQSMIILLGNNLIPVKELHYTLQWLSSLSYCRVSYECIMIMIYGFDRCQGDNVSTVLYVLGIDDDQFWPNIFQLVYIYVLLKLLFQVDSTNTVISISVFVSVSGSVFDSVFGSRSLVCGLLSSVYCPRFLFLRLSCGFVSLSLYCGHCLCRDLCPAVSASGSVFGPRSFSRGLCLGICLLSLVRGLWFAVNFRRLIVRGLYLAVTVRRFCVAVRFAIRAAVFVSRSVQRSLCRGLAPGLGLGLFNGFYIAVRSAVCPAVFASRSVQRSLCRGLASDLARGLSSCFYIASVLRSSCRGQSRGIRRAVCVAVCLFVFMSRSSRGLCLGFQASDLLLQNLEANGLGEKDKRPWPPPCIGRQPEASLVTLLAQVVGAYNRALHSATVCPRILRASPANRSITAIINAFIVGLVDGCVHIGGQSNRTWIEIEEDKSILFQCQSLIHCSYVIYAFILQYYIVILDEPHIKYKMPT